MQTTCKIGDEYYELIYFKKTTGNGTIYHGELSLNTPLSFEFVVDEKNEIATFNPLGTNPDIVLVIKESIDDDELNHAGKLML